jgi:hypothetical protein
MNSQLHQEQVGRLLDGELSEAAARELADSLNAHPELLEDLRQQLVIWEMWSQHQAPERSEQAFIDAWKTRLRAASEETDAFQKSVKSRLEPPQQEHRMQWAAALASMLQNLLRRRAGMTWAASLAVLGLVLLLWFGGSKPAQAVTTIEGEAVCTACVLHQGHEHMLAIRLTGTNAPAVYYLDLTPAVAGLQTRFCNGPTPVVANGRPRTERGRLLFEASRLVMPATPPQKQERIIFPI